MGPVNWSYRILGGLLTAFTLVSLVQRVFAIGLNPVLNDTLQTYRTLVHPVMNFLLSWIHLIAPDWEIPSILKDILALSFLGAAALHRAMLTNNRRGNLIGFGFTDPFTGAIITAFLGLTMLGLVVVIFVPVALWTLATAPKHGDYVHEEYIQSMRDLVAAFATGAIGALAFFTLNAVTLLQ